MSDTMSVRVTVLDHWDEVTFQTSPATAVGEIKQRALTETRVAGVPADYMVKYLGAELRNESESLQAAGVVSNGALIVLRRRRRPTR
jgi:hypothetical protein